jgi:hypothetical protein
MEQERQELVSSLNEKSVEVRRLAREGITTEQQKEEQDKLRSTADELKGELIELHKKTDDCEMELTSLKFERDRLAAENTSHKAENTELLSQMENHVTDKKTLREIVDQAEDELSILQRRVEGMDEERGKWEHLRQEWADELESRCESERKAALQCQNVETQCRELLSRFETLQSKNKVCSIR